MIQAPDRWIIIKIKSKEFGTTYKLLGVWLGGYTQGDSWKLNSGIKTVVDEGDYYTIMGYSKSEYRCYKDSEGMNLYMINIFENIKVNYESLATITEITMKQYLRKKHEPT